MSLTYCGNLVRQQDPDRFLLSLFAPARLRPALWALYAFNFEIAKTREVVSETTTGLIRLTWWREAIDEIYKGGVIRQHQVVQPLAQAIRDHALPQSLFDTLIFAREFDVEDRNPATLEGFFHYADYTSTPLTDLSLRILGQSEEDAAIRAASIRYASTGLLRSVPHMLIQRRCYLPESLMALHGTSSQKMFDFRQTKELPQVIEEIISTLPAVTKSSSRYLRRMNKMSGLYLTQIQKERYDVFSPYLIRRPALLPLKILF